MFSISAHGPTVDAYLQQTENQLGFLRELKETYPDAVYIDDKWWSPSLKASDCDVATTVVRTYLTQMKSRDLRFGKKLSRGIVWCGHGNIGPSFECVDDPVLVEALKKWAEKR